MITKNIAISICLFFGFQITQSQHKVTNFNEVFLPISYYNKNKKDLDSIGFTVYRQDTLVQVSNYTRPKGVSVPYEYKDSTFLNYYKQVAFRHKNDSISGETKMKYWKNGLKIYFSKSISKQNKKELLKLAEILDNEIDSLSITEVKKVEESNYIIYYEGDFEYESRMSNYKNTDYYMYWNGNNQIYKCTLRIDTDENFNEMLRLKQMKRYFIQSLGHFRLQDKFKCSSYFSNCYSTDKALSDFDLELLKYHYSYGICKGTNLETFEEQHKRAKETLKKHNRLVSYFHPIDED